VLTALSQKPGGSAKAAGDLVKQLGGVVIGYLFIIEVPGLNGIDKLDKVPTVILIPDP
jgi:adenine phosphoribosyltransferase